MQRKLVSEGFAVAKILDYSLQRWEALSRYLDDRRASIDSNQVHAAIVHDSDCCRPGNMVNAFAMLLPRDAPTYNPFRRWPHKR